MTSALIMAGGKSLRMRASLNRQHKALVKVLGVSMLERNILTLLSHNVCEIFLAVGAREKSVLAFGRGRGQNIARAAGAKLKIFVERRPLGTIGAARAVKATSGDLLVVNVDNLTALDLSALISHHRANGAALTVATHIEPFKIPFGEVSTKNGVIVDYKEKPTFPVKLCSGTYVLSKSARLEIPRGRPFGAPELVHKLLLSKHKVLAFPHASPWIDVNDSSSVIRAEALIAENFGSFELWREAAVRESINLFVLNNRGFALHRSQACEASANGQLPSAIALSTNNNSQEIADRLRGEMGLPGISKPVHVVSFDELSTRSKRRTRYHIFVAQLRPLQKKSRRERKSALSAATDLNVWPSHIRSNSRLIAYLQRYVTSQNSHSLGY
jgi:NDP-sugar pyrophosphorylase family protein